MRCLTASGRTRSVLQPSSGIPACLEPAARYSDHFLDRRTNPSRSAVMRPDSRSGTGGSRSGIRPRNCSTDSNCHPRSSRASHPTRTSSSNTAAWTGTDRTQPNPTRRSRSHRDGHIHRESPRNRRARRHRREIHPRDRYHRRVHLHHRRVHRRRRHAHRPERIERTRRRTRLPRL